ncbi:MAG: hypothetical protein JO149_01595, partial [Gammaproteobacteria bacterium]|nr:hypothetical protein [Gammaproteobacteria bacterium]
MDSDDEENLRLLTDAFSFKTIATSQFSLFNSSSTKNDNHYQNQQPNNAEEIQQLNNNLTRKEAMEILKSINVLRTAANIEALYKLQYLNVEYTAATLQILQRS